VFVSLLSAVVALAASLLLTSVPLMKVERYSLAFYPDFNKKGQHWYRSSCQPATTTTNILLIALIPVAVFEDTRAQCSSNQYIRLNHTNCIPGVGGGFH
jgi:hypothetical protein